MGRPQMRTVLNTYEQTRAGSDSEYDDIRDVQRVFGLRETKVYQLFAQGLIRGILLRRDKSSPRGRRLFSFRSIREYLVSLEDTGSAGRPHRETARLASPAATPDGTRETGERQRVLFFDPGTLRLPAD
jgi:hypothetical protein